MPLISSAPRVGCSTVDAFRPSCSLRQSFSLRRHFSGSTIKKLFPDTPSPASIPSLPPQNPSLGTGCFLLSHPGDSGMTKGNELSSCLVIWQKTETAKWQA